METTVKTKLTQLFAFLAVVLVMANVLGLVNNKAQLSYRDKIIQEYVQGVDGEDGREGRTFIVEVPVEKREEGFTDAENEMIRSMALEEVRKATPNSTTTTTTPDKAGGKPPVGEEPRAPTPPTEPTAPTAPTPPTPPSPSTICQLTGVCLE